MTAMKQRALVVDDDPGVRSLLTTLLTRQNFAVDTAEDGSQALEKINEKEKYDIVLLDLMMPKVDGASVYTYLRAHEPELADRVVMLTAFPQSAVQRLGFACPIVPKPFDMTDLLELVRERAAVA